jgi:hypothetical protein
MDKIKFEDIPHIKNSDPMDLLLEYAICGLAHNGRDTSFAMQWYNKVKPKPPVTSERLAEILRDILGREGVNSYDDLPGYLTTELSKVLDIREKE